VSPPKSRLFLAVPRVAAVAFLASAQVPSLLWAGAVIRVRPGPIAVQIDDNEDEPGGRKIFVPRPKGAGDTLDESAGRGSRAEGDVVTTIRGDRLIGRVLSIEAGGKLRLSAPDFEGEVVLLASALDRVDLMPKEKLRGDDEVLFSNGDRVAGEIVAVNPEAVIVDSKATGPLKVSRKIVQGILFARSAPATLESNFDQGRMEPWTPRGGGWSVIDGALQCATYGEMQTVFAKFDQKEAVTMEATVQSGNNRFVDCELVLFADTNDGPYGRSSIVARFFHSQFYIMCTRDGGQNHVVNTSTGRMLSQGTLRLAYDPATAKAHVWIDSNDLGEHNIPMNISQGSFVIFHSRQPCRVTRLRVLRGIVPPTAEEKDIEADAHIVRFGNKDRVSASEVTLADGKLTLRTAFGEVSSPVAKAQSIAFRQKGIEKPRRQKADVWVETTDSRLTMEFDRLTPDLLIGRSTSLGEVKVRRACLKAIRFNIYK
jgi:hypothetical protein